ncbi:YibE/F family protein [Halanaerocella petrolearia]
MYNIKKENSLPLIIIILLLLLITGLIINNNNPSEVKAIILKTDNSNVMQAGMTRIGNQYLKVKIITGRYKGSKVKATNNLKGKMNIDDYYQSGDKIVLALTEEKKQITDAKAISLYRQNQQALLFGLFVILLLLYARYTGIKALFSFISSLYVIWNFLIPGLLQGYQPLLLSAVILILLTAIIVFSVAGLNKKGLSAFTGTVSGLLVTVGITIFFGNQLGLQGMTAPFAQTLVFSGHLNLNMKHIFYASIVIGASGAAMDIAMDVAASMYEIKLKKPGIEMKELVQSGFNVGKAVIGTMTTTLLLAYSGGYLTLLMLFTTKHSSFNRMINFKIVSAEILRTVTGSIGLVLVAPITAIFAGWLYSIEESQIFNFKFIQKFKSSIQSLTSK